MVKHFVRWKEFKGKNSRGEEVVRPIAEQLDIEYRGTLLSEILSMEQKNPLSYEAAMHMTNEALRKAFKEEKLGTDFGDYQWYLDNFIEWISSLGFHIELTGDEFEPYVRSDQVA